MAIKMCCVKKVESAESRRNLHIHTNKLLPSIKQIGTICFAILISIFSISSFADNITTSPANCTQPTLNTDTGTANLNAQWEANNIKIRWYNNNTLMESGDNTCIYDTSFATAGTSSTMTRTGYEFKGWRVRPEYNFASLYTTTSGTGDWAHTSAYCRTGNTQESCSLEIYLDLEVGELKAQFSWGTLYGMIKCSETTGATVGETKNISNTEGQYCWCKATGYKPSNSDILYGPDSDLPWGFVHEFDSANSCFRGCAHWCASYMKNNSNLRRNTLGAN